MSTRACRAAGEGRRGRAGAPARAGSAQALPRSDAYLPGTQRDASGICTRRAGDRPLRGGGCLLPGSQKFPLIHFSKFG